MSSSSEYVTHSKDEASQRSGRIVRILSMTINNNNLKMSGCHSQTYFLVHYYHPGNSYDINQHTKTRHEYIEDAIEKIG